MAKQLLQQLAVLLALFLFGAHRPYSDHFVVAGRANYVQRVWMELGRVDKSRMGQNFDRSFSGRFITLKEQSTKVLFKQKNLIKKL